MTKENLESRNYFGTNQRVYFLVETGLYSGEAVRDVSADLQVGYGLDRGWFAERKLVTKGLDLTMKEADWFVNLLR